MPRYEHVCDRCDHHFSVSRPMADAGDPAFCPQCEAKARRIFHSNPIIFRPEGWNLKPDDPNYAKNLPIKQERPLAQQ